MPVDDEILAFFRERFSESESRFVIAGSEPKPDSSYQHYRAYKHERTLLKWLRGKGIACHNPIHALRKEYGTLVCQEAGIYVASRLLRHSDIRITSQHYVDQKERVVSGLGGTFSAIASTTHQGKTEDDAAA